MNRAARAQSGPANDNSVPDDRVESSAPLGEPAAAGTSRTSVFIVASPRTRVGKTFLARLLIDFLRLDRGDPVAFDLNPNGMLSPTTSQGSPARSISATSMAR